MTTNTDPVRALAELAERAVPFLRDEAAKYDDDGSNEPLELAREIETALASLSSDESALSSASSAFDGGREAAPCPHAREVDCDCANPPALASAPPSAPVGVEQSAREAVALSLDERGFHQEAQNVREGEDLDEYRDELLIARIAAALAQQPAAPCGEAVLNHPRAFGLMCTVAWTELVQALRQDGHQVNDSSGPNVRKWIESTVRDSLAAPQQPAVASGEAVGEYVRATVTALERIGEDQAVVAGVDTSALADKGRALLAATQQPAGVDGITRQQALDLWMKTDADHSSLGDHIYRFARALAAQQQGGAE